MPIVSVFCLMIVSDMCISFWYVCWLSGFHDKLSLLNNFVLLKWGSSVGLLGYSILAIRSYFDTIFKKSCGINYGFAVAICFLCEQWHVFCKIKFHLLQVLPYNSHFLEDLWDCQ